MEDLKTKTPFPLNNNNNYLKQSHHMDTEERTSSSGLLDDDTLLMMNNNFFNDDIYNYKETFLSGRNSYANNSNDAPVYDKSNNTSNSTKNYAYDDDDYDLNAEDEYDDNNDFGTGPLAPQKAAYFDQIYEDEEQQRHHRLPDDGEEEDLENDALQMNTFFKRVDSLELVKPKKAKVIKGYLMGELLGDGSYGKVKECLDMGSLARRAVKIINLKMVARKIPRGVENVRKEISIMRQLNHKNVIRLYDTFEKGNNSGQNHQALVLYILFFDVFFE